MPDESDQLPDTQALSFHIANPIRRAGIIATLERIV